MLLLLLFGPLVLLCASHDVGAVTGVLVLVLHQ
jgi:hypothetical protein